MATTQDYEAGTKAALAIVNEDIAKDVPTFFQSDITLDERQEIASGVAKAVIDALEAAHKTSAGKGE